MEIGLKNWVIQEIGGKITVYHWGEEIDFWFKLLEGLKNREFQKLGFHCIHTLYLGSEGMTSTNACRKTTDSSLLDFCQDNWQEKDG